jgi:predicted nucleotidyltransferase component of viral defense system
MAHSLHYKTVTPLLHTILMHLMQAKEFEAFRLVGGTALSLYRGHRLSIDIDLFTDAKYGSIDFGTLTSFLRANYLYVDTSGDNIIGFGKSYFVGDDKKNCIKLDVYYSTENFIDPVVSIDGIRMASVKEIIAMKIDVVSRGGRKKDFWDIHELMNEYSITQMLAMHEERHPYTHDKKLIKTNFTRFENADLDFDPVCLRGKTWEVIKLDMLDFVKGLN